MESIKCTTNDTCVDPYELHIFIESHGVDSVS
jgi:hypothetical protein